MEHAYQTFLRVTNLQDSDSSKRIQSVLRLSSQMKVSTPKGDPQDWTSRQLKRFTKKLAEYQKPETPPRTPTKAKLTGKPTRAPPKVRKLPRTPEQQRTFHVKKALDILQSAQPEIGFVSQTQFGKSFGGGGHSLEQEVEPSERMRNIMASASGATMPQMNLNPHLAHMSAHKPRTDMFNAMQSSPPNINVNVMQM